MIKIPLGRNAGGFLLTKKLTLPKVVYTKICLKVTVNFGKYVKLFCFLQMSPYVVPIQDINIDTLMAFSYTYPIKKQVLINFLTITQDPLILYHRIILCYREC